MTFRVPWFPAALSLLRDHEGPCAQCSPPGGRESERDEQKSNSTLSTLQLRDLGLKMRLNQPEGRFTDCFRILLQLQTFQGVSSLTRDRQSCSHKKSPGTSLCTCLKHLQLLLQAETPEFSQISSGKGKSQGILLLTGFLKGSFSATCGVIQKQKWNQWDRKHNWCPAADALSYSWVLTPSCHVHEENEL